MKKLLESFLTFVTAIVPIRKDIWIFSSWGGRKISDNPLYFYQYVLSTNLPVKLIWIVKDKKLIRNKFGYEAYYYKSPKGVFYQLVAGAVFFTHGVKSDFFRSVVNRKSTRINMWHGFPWKKIGLDDAKFNKSYSRLFYRVKNFFLNERYDYFLSLGNVCTNIMVSAFEEPRKKFLEIGFPRNDYLKPKSRHEDSAWNILYMPTFRGGVDQEVDLLKLGGFECERVVETLQSKNSRLIIKLHPVNRLPSSYVDNLNIEFGSDQDAMELLNWADVLVTDFSSVAFDFVVSSKPVLFLVPDKEAYERFDRGLNLSLEEVTGNHYFESWDEMLSKMPWRTACLENSNQVLMSYHRFADNGSSRRLLGFLTSSILDDKYTSFELE